MKRKSIFLFMLIVVMALALFGCGGGGAPEEEEQAADESWTKIEDKGELILGLDEEFPPMGFRDENGEITGFDVDVAKEACSRLGIELKLQPINWDVKEQELNTGKIDCIWNGFTITEERKKALLYSDPYMNNKQIIVVMKDSPVASLEDLKGKKLGYQAGSSSEDALNAATELQASLGEVVKFDDFMTALMDLEKGGLDAVLIDEVVANYNINASGKEYKILDETLAGEEYGIGFRKGDQALMEKIQETLEAMAKDGKLAEISEKWFGQDITIVGK